MNESGFSIGNIQASHIIINVAIRSVFQVNPGRQEWVSVVECICVDGTTILLLIIFKGENLSSQWIPASIHEDWRFSCNSRGWTSNTHGVEWLHRCFEPSTWEKANGHFYLLICNGYNSYVSGNFIAHCMDNDIILMILPPHSSHLTQPLDIGIFGSLKTAISVEIDPLV